MRQVLSWRFFVSIVALVLIAVGIYLAVGRDESVAEVVRRQRRPDRRADLISLVYSIERDGFSVAPNGRTRGQLTLILPGDPAPIARVYPGTPAEVSCTNFDQIGQCALVADLLGDAVVRFALVPMGPRFTFELPAIVELDGGYAMLNNGWQVPYADVIDRDGCESPAESFSEFLETVGTAHRSVFSLGRKSITAVVC